MRGVRLPLSAQIALVTGAGRGLGRSVALRLAELGASVVLAARSEQELEGVRTEAVARGARVVARPTDVADGEQVEALVRLAGRELGPVTILVNNAGTIEPISPLARTEAAAWRRNIAVNLIGAYNATHAVLPGMLERGYGRIVNISSIAATRPSARWTAYSAAKAGLDQLTRSLALELSGTGVTVCSFNPRRMETAMQARIRQSRLGDRSSEGLTGPAQHPSGPGRIVAYLSSPLAQHNGDVLVMGDPQLAAASAALDEA